MSFLSVELEGVNRKLACWIGCRTTSLAGCWSKQMRESFGMASGIQPRLEPYDARFLPHREYVILRIASACGAP